MSDFNLLLDAFPEAALLARQGLITAVNPLARHYLPQLEAGAPLPEYMAVPLHAPSGAGAFTAGLSRYDFSVRDMGGGETLVLFHPAPQSALTDTQLDGALRQMRQLLNDVLVSIDQQSQLPASLPKSYYQMFRLLNNLEFLRSAADRQGVDFHPVTMDLAGLCRHVTDAAAPLLADQGVQLTFVSSLTSLLIPGDPQLLQRLLLELIANSVRAVGKGAIRLSLSLQGRRALLSLSDSGAAPLPGSWPPWSSRTRISLSPPPAPAPAWDCPSPGTLRPSTAAPCWWSGASPAPPCSSPCPPGLWTRGPR